MNPATPEDTGESTRILLIRSTRITKNSGYTPGTILRNHGFKVTTVRSLRAAAEIITTAERFDLVIAAVDMLPRTDPSRPMTSNISGVIAGQAPAFIACDVDWVRSLLDSVNTDSGRTHHVSASDSSPIEYPHPIPIPMNAGPTFIVSGVYTALEYFRTHTRNRQLQTRILQMRENERRFRSLVENQGEGIGIVDSSERFVFANPAGERIFGLPLGGLVGRSLEEFTDTEEFTRIRMETERRSEGLRSSYELTITGADGVRRDILLTATPQFDEAGTFSGTMGIFLDVTERNRMARALREKEQKMKSLLHEKELLLQEVQHRIKNNLAMIISLLSLKLQSLDSEVAKDALRISIGRIQGIRIIYQMLHLGSDVHNVPIQSYISDLLRGITDSYRTDGIDIDTEIENISMDAETAVQSGILINELVTNAVKYAFPGSKEGMIRVICRQDDTETVRIIVSDDGIGLPPDVDVEKPESFGFKLICALVKQLSGEIDITRDGGTRVTVWIPPAPKSGLHELSSANNLNR